MKSNGISVRGWKLDNKDGRFWKRAVNRDKLVNEKLKRSEKREGGILKSLNDNSNEVAGKGQRGQKEIKDEECNATRVNAVLKQKADPPPLRRSLF